MTIPSSVDRTDYVGNGSVDTYATTFAVMSTTEVRVFVENAGDGQDHELTLGVDYSAALNPAGLCSVTLTAGDLPNGLRLSLQRGLPFTQAVDPTASAAYSAAVMAVAIDRLAMQLQRLKGEVARCLRIPYLEAGGDGVTKIPSAAAERALKSLVFDANGNIAVGGTLAGSIFATAFGQSLIDDASAAEARDTLGIPGTRVADGVTDDVLTTTGTLGVWKKLTTPNLSDKAVTLGKIQDFTEARLLGRGDGGGNGVAQEIALGDNLALVGTTLNVTDVPLKALFAAFDDSAIIAITGADTATANRLHVASGTSADYTITLPSAPATGTVVGFYVKDHGAADKQYKLDAGVGVKIAGRTRYLVLVHTNVAVLRFDGTDWQPLVLSLDTPWVLGSNVTITATTTNPTKGTGVTEARYWRRVGRSIEINQRYVQTGSGTAGVGDYLWDLPIGQIDTTIAPVNTSGSSQAVRCGGFYGVFRCRNSIDDTPFVHSPLPYTSTTFRIVYDSAIISNSHKALNNAFSQYNGLAFFPMLDW